MKQVAEFLESFVIIALVLAGISGLSYKLLGEEGWLESMIGNIWDLDTQYSLIAIPLLIAAIILFNMWRGNRVIHSKSSKLPDIILYGLFATGVYFIGRYVLTGSI